MTFKDYRHKNIERAAVITEDGIVLVPYSQIGMEVANQTRKMFVRGDYCLLGSAELYGIEKAEFEAEFEPRRAERQSKTRRPRKAKAAGESA